MNSPTEVYVYVRKLAPVTRVCLALFEVEAGKYRVMKSLETDAPCDADWFRSNPLAAEYLDEGMPVDAGTAAIIRDRRVGLLLDNNYELESVQLLNPGDPGFVLEAPAIAYWMFGHSEPDDRVWAFFKHAAQKAGAKHSRTDGVLFESDQTKLIVTDNARPNGFTSFDLCGGGTFTGKDVELLALIIRLGIEIPLVEFSSDGEDDAWAVANTNEAFEMVRKLGVDEDAFRDAAVGVGLCQPPVDLSAIRSENTPSLFF